MSLTANPPSIETLEGDPPAVLLSPDEAIVQLRQMQVQMPQLELELSRRRTLRGQLQHVNPQFIGAAVAAVGTSEVVQSALGRTDEDLRAEIDLAARWFAMADEARAVLRRSLVIGTVLRQRIGLAALQTYKICTQLERDVKHANLNTHVAEMRRLNKFGRARRRPPSPETFPEIAASDKK